MTSDTIFGFSSRTDLTIMSSICVILRSYVRNLYREYVRRAAAASARKDVTVIRYIMFRVLPRAFRCVPWLFGMYGRGPGGSRLQDFLTHDQLRRLLAVVRNLVLELLHCLEEHSDEGGLVARSAEEDGLRKQALPLAAALLAENEGADGLSVLLMLEVKDVVAQPHEGPRDMIPMSLDDSGDRFRTTITPRTYAQGMQLSSMFGMVMSKLHEDLKQCRSQVKDCPWFVHLSGSARRDSPGSFSVSFTKTDHAASNVLSFAYCRVLPDLYEGRVMMEVSQPRAMKKEFGCPPRHFDDSHHWYKQEWRNKSFVMECEAGPLWHYLERGVDLDALNLDTVRDVLEK